MGLNQAIDISAEQRKTILGLLRSYLPNTTAWVYGSRVKWTSRPQSDLDMVVFAAPEQERQVSNLREAFEESNLPFRVDLFVWDTVPEQFHEEIEADHVVLVEQEERGLPHNWSEQTLGELTNNFDSIRVPVKQADRRSGPYPYYGASGIVDHINDYLFDGEYLLIAEDGENLRTRNTPIAFLANGKFWVNNHAHIVRGNHKANTQFLMYALSGLDVSGYLTGSTMPKLTQGNLNCVSLQTPPLPEQRAIAHVLGTLDDKIELNRRMNQTLEGMARALFKSWFVDFDPVRAKMEGRETGLPPNVADLFPERLVGSDLGEIPEGWEVKKVSGYASIKGGKHIPKDQFIKNGPVPVFGGAGRMGYTDNYNANGFVISVGRVGAYCGQFFSHMGRAWINNNASLITPYKGVPGEWLLLALRNLDIDVIKKGAAQPFVSNSDLAAMKIIGPNQVVLKAFRTLSESLFQRSRQIEKKMNVLTSLRDTLLPKLISGEIQVKDTDTFLQRVL